MDREQASGEGSGQSVQCAVLASSEGAQGEGAQAEEAQEALPLSDEDQLRADYESSVLNRFTGPSWRKRGPSLLSLRRYKMRQAIVARIIQATNSTRAKGKVQDGSDSLDCNDWFINACDCGSCDRHNYECVQCLKKTSENQTVFDKSNNNRVCLACFDYYFTMLQLEGRNNAR